MNEATAQRLHALFAQPTQRIERWIHAVEGLRIDTTQGYVGYKVFTAVLRALRRLRKQGVLMRDGTHLKALMARAMTEYEGQLDTLSAETLLCLMDAKPLPFPYIEEASWRARHRMRDMAKLPRAKDIKHRKQYLRMVTTRNRDPAIIAERIRTRDAKKRSKVLAALDAAGRGAQWDDTINPLKRHIANIKRRLRNADNADSFTRFDFFDAFLNDLLLPLRDKLMLFKYQGTLRVVALREGAPNGGYTWVDWVSEEDKRRWITAAGDAAEGLPKATKDALFARPSLTPKTAPYRAMVRKRTRDRIDTAIAQYTLMLEKHTAAGRDKQAARVRAMLGKHTQALEVLDSYPLNMPAPANIRALFPKTEEI